MFLAQNVIPDCLHVNHNITFVNFEEYTAVLMNNDITVQT